VESAIAVTNMYGIGCSLTQFSVAMVLVVKLLKDVYFVSERVQVWESLTSEKALVVGIVETLDDAVSPGFAFGDKDDFNPELETQADNQTEAPWVFI
jgi:hypothetical protein